MEPRYLNVKDAATLVGVSDRTIYRALWAGELRGYQRRAPNGGWRITWDDLDTWVCGG